MHGTALIRGRIVGQLEPGAVLDLNGVVFEFDVRVWAHFRGFCGWIVPIDWHGSMLVAFRHQTKVIWLADDLTVYRICLVFTHTMYN